MPAHPRDICKRRFDEARPLLEKPLLRRAVVANAPDAQAQANAQVALALAAMRLGDKTKARPIGYQLSGGVRHHLDALQGKLADQFDWLVVDEAVPYSDGE